MPSSNFWKGIVNKVNTDTDKENAERDAELDEQIAERRKRHGLDEETDD